MAALYGDLTFEQATGTLGRQALFLPLGAIEQHGPHLPLTVDLDIATAFATDVADRTGGLLAPPVAYAARSLPASGGGPAYPGGIAVRAATLISYLREVVVSFAAAGARQVVVVNGHYENEGLLFEALEEAREAGIGDTRLLAVSWWNLLDTGTVATLAGNDFVGWHAEHAAFVETSLMLHLRPATVRAQRVDHDHPPPAGVYLHPAHPETSTDGVLSRTSGASPEAGQQLFEDACKRLEHLVRAQEEGP